MPKAEAKQRLEKDWLYGLAPNVDPNLVTGLSMLGMLAAAYYVLRAELVLAGVFVLVSGFLDALDGAVAKRYKKQTKFGTFIDSTADRINDAIILASITLAGLVSLQLGLFTLAIVLVASYESAVLDSLSRVKRAEALSTRWLRLLLIAGGLIAGQPALAVVAVLAVAFFSFFERLWAASKLD